MAAAEANPVVQAVDLSKTPVSEELQYGFPPPHIHRRCPVVTCPCCFVSRMDVAIACATNALKKAKDANSAAYGGGGGGGSGGGGSRVRNLAISAGLIGVVWFAFCRRRGGAAAGERQA